MSGDFVISTKTDWLAIMQDDQYLMRIKPFKYVGLMADAATTYLPEIQGFELK
jgi:hypothetical protein